MAVRQRKGGCQKQDEPMAERWDFRRCFAVAVGFANGLETTHIILIKQGLSSAGLVLLVTALLWLKLDLNCMAQFTRSASIISHPILDRS